MNEDKILVNGKIIAYTPLDKNQTIPEYATIELDPKIIEGFRDKLKLKGHWDGTIDGIISSLKSALNSALKDSEPEKKEIELLPLTVSYCEIRDRLNILTEAINELKRGK